MGRQDPNSNTCAGCGGDKRHCDCRDIRISDDGDVGKQDPNSRTCGGCGGEIGYCDCAIYRSSNDDDDYD